MPRTFNTAQLARRIAGRLVREFSVRNQKLPTGDELKTIAAVADDLATAVPINRAYRRRFLTRDQVLNSYSRTAFRAR